MLAHLHSGLEQVLADVGQTCIGGLVGVVGHDRDPGGQCLLHRTVERGRRDQGRRDPVDLLGDRGVDRIDHLPHVARLRAGPLIGAAEQLAGIGRAVLGRGEEHVGGHVVDHRELVLGAVAEDRAPQRCPRRRPRSRWCSCCSSCRRPAAQALRFPATPPVSAVRRVTCDRRLCGESGSLRSSHSRRSTASSIRSSRDMDCSSLKWLAPQGDDMRVVQPVRAPRNTMGALLSDTLRGGMLAVTSCLCQLASDVSGT